MTFDITIKMQCNDTLCNETVHNEMALLIATISIKIDMYNYTQQCNDTLLNDIYHNDTL
jgi:hypothetical protein